MSSTKRKEREATFNWLKSRCPLSWQSFLDEMGGSRSWGYRARRDGLIRAVRVGRKLVVLPDDLDRFNARASAGEFASVLGGACRKGGQKGANQ